MKTYCIIMADGTSVDLQSDCFIQEDSCISFVDIVSDEEDETAAMFNLDNIAGFYEVK